MKIAHERPQDVATIHAVITAAFKDAPYSHQTEARIVDALRHAGALTLSLTATIGEQIIGHAAFSPVRINGEAGDWFGLGPVSVLPEQQRRGIGSAIIKDGLHQLRALKAAGCVVFGEPDYYSRFGFISDPHLFYAGAPDGYFQRLSFTPLAPVGEVIYHPGFDVF